MLSVAFWFPFVPSSAGDIPYFLCVVSGRRLPARGDSSFCKRPGEGAGMGRCRSGALSCMLQGEQWEGGTRWRLAGLRPPHSASLAPMGILYACPPAATRRPARRPAYRKGMGEVRPPAATPPVGRKPLLGPSPGSAAPSHLISAVPPLPAAGPPAGWPPGAPGAPPGVLPLPLPPKGAKGGKGGSGLGNDPPPAAGERPAPAAPPASGRRQCRARLNVGAGARSPAVGRRFLLNPVTQFLYSGEIAGGQLDFRDIDFGDIDQRFRSS
eukprot:gene17954-biopygen2164